MGGGKNKKVEVKMTALVSGFNNELKVVLFF
jgi:hypothetical protein